MTARENFGQSIVITFLSHPRTAYWIRVLYTVANGRVTAPFVTLPQGLLFSWTLSKEMEIVAFSGGDR